MAMRVEEKSWNEFWAAYWRIERRHQIPGIFEWDCQLVEFIEHVCLLAPGARLLDLGCGGGDQAKLLARKGYVVVGIDIAPSLIEFANRQFATENLRGTFIIGAMRAIDYTAEFDACLVLSGTFGFFGDVEDEALLCAISRALKPGGKAFIMFVPIGRAGKRTRSWSETKDGWELSETWFDVEASTYRSRIVIIRNDGVILRPKPEPGYHADEVIRCYTVPEMQAMFVKVGLHYRTSYSSDDLSVPPKPLAVDVVRNIIVAERSIEK
jgi:SAM-dependent methyltransferase